MTKRQTTRNVVFGTPLRSSETALTPCISVVKRIGTVISPVDVDVLDADCFEDAESMDGGDTGLLTDEECKFAVRESARFEDDKCNLLALTTQTSELHGHFGPSVNAVGAAHEVDDENEVEEMTMIKKIYMEECTRFILTEPKCAA